MMDCFTKITLVTGVVDVSKGSRRHDIRYQGEEQGYEVSQRQSDCLGTLKQINAKNIGG